MKQLLKILHRLSYLFVIPILIIFLLFYATGTVLFNIPYWIVTGKSLLETEDTVINIITDWMDKYYPIFIETKE